MLRVCLLFLAIGCINNEGRQRTTTDSKECALVFVQNGVTYTDCTVGLTPDGKTKGKEWCYIDSKYTINLEKGIKNWGFCNQLLEYDKLRAATDESYRQLTIEAIKTRQQIEKFLDPSLQLLQEFNQVQQNNQENKMLVDKLQQEFSFFKEEVDLWQQQLEKLKNLKKQQAELKARIKNKKELLASQNDSKNCDGIVGYETESDGEGLNAYFYANENFMGAKTTHDFLSMNIKFSRNEPSIANFENFSLEMDGFIKAPSDGKYFFQVKCDDYCIISINDMVIQDSYKKQESKKPMYLLGQKKYKIQVKYFHSVHNLYDNYDNAFLKIQWEIENIQFIEEIPMKYLYKSNKLAPLKFSNYDLNLFEPAIFSDFRNAFKSEELYKLADIPLEFQGINMLQMKMGFSNQEIKITTNSPSIVYIGIPFENKSEWNILDGNFKNTQRIFSVLRLPKKMNQQMRAQESIKYIIFERQFDEAEIVIKLEKEEKRGVNWVLFYRQDTKSEKDFLSCGGEVEELSNVQGGHFGDCSESSRYSGEDYGCKAGLAAGDMEDVEGKVWASDNEGPGAYIQLDFKGEVQITRLDYLNRESIAHRTKRIDIQWTGGGSRSYQINNHKGVTVIKIEPSIVTRYIRMTLGEVYSSGNNGGAFKVWGMGCQRQALGNQGGTEVVDDRTVDAGCLDNLYNHQRLKAHQHIIGQAWRVFCREGCQAKDYQVYGHKIFKGDSSICKAAYYMGLVAQQGGTFMLKLVRGLESYQGSTGPSHITSEFAKGSVDQLAFQVEQVADPKVLALNDYFLGQQVDIYDQTQKQWLAGVITELNMQSLGQLAISVAKQGYDHSFDEHLVLTTDHRDTLKDKLDYCGGQLSQRICNAQSQHLHPGLLEYQVCFTVLDKCDLHNQYGGQQTGEAIADNGDMYSQKKGGVWMGWNRRMNDHLRQRHGGKGFIENNLILFPPDPRSKWCRDTTQPLDCETAFWQLKVASAGDYQVKVTMGDSEYNSKYLLRVNDQVIARNVYLGKNQWLTAEARVKVGGDGLVKVWADCQTDCDQVWSRMSFVQIQQLAPEVLGDQPMHPYQNLGCGSSYSGGRCVSGPDVENCVYSSLQDPGVSHCHQTLQVIHIPHTYYCQQQRGMYKCIRNQYLNPAQCKATCPARCVANVCKL